MNNKWHKRFLKLAHEIASWSKDKSTKVGAIIIDEERTPRSFGYNGFPPGVNDDLPERQDRAMKLKLSVHAEQNSINHCAKTGIPIKGCIIYTTHFPCSGCARSIIGAGITQVIVDQASLESDFKERWAEDIEISKIMFEEAKIKVTFVNLNDPE